VQPMKTIALLMLLAGPPPIDALAQDTHGDQDAGPYATADIAPSEAYQPITPRERVNWIVTSIVGPKSLAVGVWSGAWDTAFNTPEEWGRTWEGLGKRYLARGADVVVSSSLEAGVGAIWGEEPRYIPSHRSGFWSRTGFAATTVFLAQRRDGHLAPAWGRYVGNTLNNVIANAWLPPSVTTPGQTALRSANGVFTRLVGNLWSEFWPDARRWLARRGAARDERCRANPLAVCQPTGTVLRPSAAQASDLPAISDADETAATGPRLAPTQGGE